MHTVCVIHVWLKEADKINKCLFQLLCAATVFYCEHGQSIAPAVSMYILFLNLVDENCLMKMILRLVCRLRHNSAITCFFRMTLMPMVLRTASSLQIDSFGIVLWRYSENLWLPFAIIYFIFRNLLSAAMTISISLFFRHSILSFWHISPAIEYLIFGPEGSNNIVYICIIRSEEITIPVISHLY